MRDALIDIFDVEIALFPPNQVLRIDEPLELDFLSFEGLVVEVGDCLLSLSVGAESCNSCLGCFEYPAFVIYISVDHRISFS